MDVHVIQTSDAARYKPLFDITSRASARWCAVQGLVYAPFVGLKLGRHPWHAIFNRIPLLCDLAASGFRGWAIYLDADSYPFDLGLDVRVYLAARAGYALIGVPCQADQMLPNSGILLLNFSDPRTHLILAAWRARLERIYPDGALPDAAEWPSRTENDQSMLHHVLAARGDVLEAVHFAPGALIGNPDSTFLRQITRAEGDFTARCADAARGVAVALGVVDTDQA